MGNNPEGKDGRSELQRAVTREILTSIAEFQEKKASTASDPKERESAKRQAEVARDNLRDLK
jgi:hypothetical protein